MESHDDLFEMSSLSSLSLRNSFDFYCSEASALQHLLQVESILMLQDERLFGDLGSTSAGSPPRPVSLRRSFDNGLLVAAREQCYGQVFPGVGLSRPAVSGSLVVFGTEDTPFRSGNNFMFMVDSIFAPCKETRTIPIANSVTAVSFVASDQVVFGMSGGEAMLLQTDGDDAAPPVSLQIGHCDDIRDFALLRDSNKSQLASCSYDGNVVITDLANGCPILKMNLETEVSSVCAHASNSHVVSATTDAGFFCIRDLRVGRRNSGLCEQKIVVAGSGLVDHCWSAREDQAVLAFQDGLLACVDARRGEAISFVNSVSDLDSVDFHGPSSTLAACGRGVGLFCVQSGLFRSAGDYCPKYDRADRNAGSFNESGQLFITNSNDASLVLLDVVK